MTDIPKDKLNYILNAHRPSLLNTSKKLRFPHTVSYGQIDEHFYLQGSFAAKMD